MSLEIKVEKKKDGVFLISLTGEINTETHQEFEDKVRKLLDGAKGFVFDLKGVSYISSMGLSALFRIKQAMEEKSGTIMLVNPQPQIQTVFESMKILPENMFASLQEADEYLDTFLDGIQKGKIQPNPPKG